VRHTANFTTTNNYRYDAGGNLAADRGGGILQAEWNAANKLTGVVKAGNEHIYFVYDALGNRIVKTHVRGPSIGGRQALESTYYVRDAGGNTMAVYSLSYNPVADSSVWRLVEQPIYGSGRIGEYRPGRVIAAHRGLPGAPGAGTPPAGGGSASILKEGQARE
jgi:YD repeat-containing protein